MSNMLIRSRRRGLGGIPAAGRPESGVFQPAANLLRCRELNRATCLIFAQARHFARLSPELQRKVHHTKDNHNFNASKLQTTDTDIHRGNCDKSFGTAPRGPQGGRTISKPSQDSDFEILESSFCRTGKVASIHDIKTAHAETASASRAARQTKEAVPNAAARRLRVRTSRTGDGSTHNHSDGGRHGEDLHRETMRGSSAKGTTRFQTPRESDEHNAAREGGDGTSHSTVGGGATTTPSQDLQNQVQQAALVRRILHPRTKRIDQLFSSLPQKGRERETASDTTSSGNRAAATRRKSVTLDRKDFLQLLQQVHPDRNSHPDAAQAFAKLQNLWQVYSDADTSGRGGEAKDAAEEATASSSTAGGGVHERSSGSRNAGPANSRTVRQQRTASSDVDDVLADLLNDQHRGGSAFSSAGTKPPSSTNLQDFAFSPVPELDLHSPASDIEHSMCERSAQAMRIQFTDEILQARSELLNALQRIDAANWKKKPVKILKRDLQGLNRDEDRLLELKLKCFGFLGNFCWERYRVARSRQQLPGVVVKKCMDALLWYSRKFHCGGDDDVVPIKLSDRIVNQIVLQYCTNPTTRKRIAIEYHKAFMEYEEKAKVEVEHAQNEMTFLPANSRSKATKTTRNLTDLWENLLLEANKVANQAGFNSVADVQNSMLCVHERVGVLDDKMSDKKQSAIFPLMQSFSHWFSEEVFKNKAGNEKAQALREVMQLDHAGAASGSWGGTQNWSGRRASGPPPPNTVNLQANKVGGGTRAAGPAAAAAEENKARNAYHVVSDLPAILRHCMPYLTRTIDRVQTASCGPQAILVDKDFELLMSILGSILQVKIVKEDLLNHVAAAGTSSSRTTPSASAGAAANRAGPIKKEEEDHHRDHIHQPTTAKTTADSTSPPKFYALRSKPLAYHVFRTTTNGASTTSRLQLQVDDLTPKHSNPNFLGTIEFNFKQNSLSATSKNALQNACAQFVQPKFVRMMNLSGDLVSKDCRAILLTNLRAVVHELGHAMHFLHTPHQQLSNWGLALSPDLLELPSTLFELFLEEDLVLRKLIENQPKGVRIKGVIQSVQGLSNGFQKKALRVREENFWMCQRAYLENLAWGSEVIEFIAKKTEMNSTPASNTNGGSSCSTSGGASELQLPIGVLEAHDQNGATAAVHLTEVEDDFAAKLAISERTSGDQNSLHASRNIRTSTSSAGDVVAAEQDETSLLPRGGQHDLRHQNFDSLAPAPFAAVGRRDDDENCGLTSSSPPLVPLVAAQEDLKKSKFSSLGRAKNDYQDLSHFFLDRYSKVFCLQYSHEVCNQVPSSSTLSSSSTFSGNAKQKKESTTSDGKNLFHPLAIPELRLLFTDSQQTYPALTYIFARCRSRQWYVESRWKESLASMKTAKNNIASSTANSTEANAFNSNGPSSSSSRVVPPRTASPIVSEILERNFYQFSKLTTVPTKEELWLYFFRGKEDV
ncbi:unnamed protein product [Amoebophrya sp. A120]|nr:unnamed protein product [Amoebophrya sp. A120]|eukprot:GSA120T00019544001.1